MTDVAIRVEGLGKLYSIGSRKARYKTLRESLSVGARQRARALTSFFSTRHGWGTNQRPQREVIAALQDVSFEVNAGDVIGIVGRNGAGKSTLLKILSRVTAPSTGFAELNGIVGSLLEVGTGFHPELTGRENIFLNGAILGMQKKEIERKFERIVEFSEVTKFIDTPVKHYSSGMYLRLAFAVAAHLDPDIMLVDEVLAVGDAAFQQKCLGKMGEVAKDGRTVLFVSHNIAAVRALCSRAIWINDGAVVANGNVDAVTNEYLSTLVSSSVKFANLEHEITIEKVVLKNDSGASSCEYSPGENLEVEIRYRAARAIERPHLLLIVQGQYGACFTANMLLDGHRPARLDGSGVISCRFKELPLLPQNYIIKLDVRTCHNERMGGQQEIASFSVVGDLRAYGFAGDFLMAASRSTPVIVPYEWVLPDGSVRAVDLKKNGVSATDSDHEAFEMELA